MLLRIPCRRRRLELDCPPACLPGSPTPSHHSDPEIPPMFETEHLSEHAHTIWHVCDAGHPYTLHVDRRIRYSTSPCPSLLACTRPFVLVSPPLASARFHSSKATALTTLLSASRICTYTVLHEPGCGTIPFDSDPVAVLFNGWAQCWDYGPPGQLRSICSSSRRDIGNTVRLMAYPARAEATLFLLDRQGQPGTRRHSGAREDFVAMTVGACQQRQCAIAREGDWRQR